jgi:hypothetical protein
VFLTKAISLTEKLISSYNKVIAFQQAMGGTVEITAEDAGLIQRFFYQFQKILNR